MGGLFGGQKQTTSSSSTTAPWGPQQQPLIDLINNATQLFNGQGGITAQYAPGIQLYAPMNGTEQEGVGALTDMSRGFLGTGQNVANLGTGALSGLPTASGVASNFATGNFNPGSVAGANYAAGNVPTTVNASNQGILSALQSATTDPTQANIASAGQYADNPYIASQIDAANRDVQRDLYENQLPTLDANAIAGGNLNSSRAGAASAIAQRGAADRMADTAAAIRGNAYQQGLNLAEGAREANNNAALGAAGVANTATGLGLTGEANANANRLSNIGVQLNGNGQLLDTVGAGSGLLSQGTNLQQAGGTGLLNAGGVLQQNQQNQDNADLQRWMQSQQYPWQMLQNLQGIVGQKYGAETSGTQTTENSGNPIGGILGLGALAAAPFSGGSSLFGSLGSGLATVPGIGSGLGALSGATGISSGLFGGPTVGTSTMTPYWQALMARA